MSCLREVQTISKSPHILPMPSLTRLTSGGVLNPLKNTTNTSHNELLHQDPLQPPLEPRLPAYAVRAAPSHVVGAHSTESAPLLPDGGTGHNSLETWLALLGRLGQQAGQLMSRGQANNEAAAQHRVNLAV